MIVVNIVTDSDRVVESDTDISKNDPAVMLSETVTLSDTDTNDTIVGTDCSVIDMLSLSDMKEVTSVVTLSDIDTES